MIDKSDVQTFTLRRAWLVGACSRSDIARAFGKTAAHPTYASEVMRSAVSRWPEHLYWAPRKGIVPITSAQLPPQADASTVLELIASGAPPTVTGLFPTDGAGLLMPRIKPCRALTPQATQVALTCCARETPMRILYVGMRKGESARWRMVWPRALEFTGSQWRIHAQDVDDDGKIKVYVLSRIFEAIAIRESEVPSTFGPKKLVATTRHLRVSLNQGLTDDQAAAVRNALDISPGGVMSWPDHSLYEFKRDHTDTPAPNGITWPVLDDIEVLE